MYVNYVITWACQAPPNYPAPNNQYWSVCGANVVFMATAFDQNTFMAGGFVMCFPPYRYNRIDMGAMGCSVCQIGNNAWASTPGCYTQNGPYTYQVPGAYYYNPSNGHYYQAVDGCLGCLPNPQSYVPTHFTDLGTYNLCVFPNDAAAIIWVPSGLTAQVFTNYDYDSAWNNGNNGIITGAGGIYWTGWKGQLSSMRVCATSQVYPVSSGPTC